MGDVVLSGEGRDNQQRHPEPSVLEIANGAVLSSRRAHIARPQVLRWDAVGADRGLRRHMVVEATTLVETQNEYGTLPGRTSHQGIDDAGHVLGTHLDIAGYRRVIVRGMLVAACGISSFDHGNVGQLARGYIREVLG